MSSAELLRTPPPHRRHVAATGPDPHHGSFTPTPLATRHLDRSGVDFTPSHPNNAGLAPHYCPICMLHFPAILETKCCKNLICGSCAKDIVIRATCGGGRGGGGGGPSSQRGWSRDIWSVIAASTPARPTRGGGGGDENNSGTGASLLDAPPLPRPVAGGEGIRRQGEAAGSYVRRVIAASNTHPYVVCPFCTKTMKVRPVISVTDECMRTYRDTPNYALLQQRHQSRVDDESGAREAELLHHTPVAQRLELEANPQQGEMGIVARTPPDGEVRFHRRVQGAEENIAAPRYSEDGSPLPSQPDSNEVDNNHNHHRVATNYSFQGSKFAKMKFGTIGALASRGASGGTGIDSGNSGQPAAASSSSQVQQDAAAAAPSPVRVGASFDDLRRKLMLFPKSATFQLVSEDDVEHDPDRLRRRNEQSHSGAAPQPARGEGVVSHSHDGTLVASYARRAARPGAAGATRGSSHQNTTSAYAHQHQATAGVVGSASSNAPVVRRAKTVSPESAAASGDAGNENNNSTHWCPIM